jgi:hypothetical protein
VFNISGYPPGVGLGTKKSKNKWRREEAKIKKRGSTQTLIKA